MPRSALNPIVKNLRRAAAATRFDGLPDGELLERFRGSTDPDAFEAIVRRFGERVLAACHKVLTDPADVDDAFQATFLVLLRDAGRVRRQQALGGYLYGVAHRVALQARARAARRARAEGRKPPRLEEAAPDLTWREACGILHEELDRLPDSYRLPLLLCYLEGKSRDEAAQQLGVKLDVLRGRLERGRDRLRSRLIKRGVTLSAGLLAAVAGSAQAAGLPARLVEAAVANVEGPGAPATVTALVRGAATPTRLGKFKLAAVALLAAGLIAGGLGWRMTGAPATEPDPAGEPAAAAGPAKAGPVQPVAVSGRVLGPDGKPVPGAKLMVLDRVAEDWRPAPQAEAGADGRFAFALPPPPDGRGGRTLVATAPDRGLGCDWAAATPDVVLKLPRDEPVRGRVVDLEGRPVPGATVAVTEIGTGADDTLNEFVRLWSKDREKQFQAYSTVGGRWLYVWKYVNAREAGTPFFRATTGPDGRFTLAGIGRDRCPHLVVRAPGKGTQVCVVVLRADFKPAPPVALTDARVFGPDFTLPLVPAVPVTGVVRDAATGKPLAGVRVRGQVDLSESMPYGFLVLPDVGTVTDAEGKYALDGLPLGKMYVLLADPKPGDGPVHRFAVRKDEAPGSGPLRADFALPRGVVLTGQVRDGKTGRPVFAQVSYQPLWSNRWAQDHPDYAAPGIAPHYTEAEGQTDAEGRFKLTVLPGPGVLEVFALERTYLPAKLAPADDNDEVILEEVGRKAFKTTGQGGHTSPSQLSAYRVLRIPAGASTFTADATVDPGVDRAVRIVGPDGRPVVGARVLEEQSRVRFSDPLAGAEVTVYALAAGESRRVYARHDDRKLAGFVTVDDRETGPVVLRLEPTATLTGRVVDRAGRPLKGVRVRPVFEDARLEAVLSAPDRDGDLSAVTGADGRFTLANVPAGLAVSFDARTTDGKTLGHETARRTLTPGQALDLGDWKPK